MQVLLPLAPEVESIFEPIQEELDEAVASAREAMDDMQVCLPMIIGACWTPQAAITLHCTKLSPSKQASARVLLQEDAVDRYHTTMSALRDKRPAGSDGETGETQARLTAALKALSRPARKRLDRDAEGKRDAE